MEWDRAREHKAEHDAFINDVEAIIKKRPKDLPLLQPLGKGSASIIRVVLEYV